MTFINDTAAENDPGRKNKFLSDLLWLTAALIFVMFIMSPVLSLGIPSGHDLKHHFQCAMVFYNSILGGDWFPNWSANVNYGFGDVGARLYPPVGYYVLAVARMLTGSWYGAGQAAFIFWMLLGVTGIYLWARNCRVSPVYAALAGVLYSMAPYHLARVYQLFLYAEFAGASILPFCFLFTVRIARRDNKNGGIFSPRSFGDVIGLAISFGLLALTHIPITLIAMTGIVFYGLFITERPFWQAPRPVVKIFAGLALGMSAAAWQWIKIVSEMNWVNIGVEPLPEKYLYYKNHFFPLYFSTRENWYMARQLYLLDSITVLTLLTALVPVGALLVWRHRNRRANPANLPNQNIDGAHGEKKAEIDGSTAGSNKGQEEARFGEGFYKNLRALSFIGLAAFFLITLGSAFIWRVLPMLQKIQFPWRWLSLVALVGTLGLAAGLEYLMQCGKNIARVTGYLLITLLLLVGLFNLTQLILPLGAIARPEFETLMSPLPEETSLIDWWTIWGRQKAFSDRRQAFAERAEKVQISGWKNEEREFEVSGAAEHTVLRVATFYYPYWQAEINGVPAAVAPGEDGTINLNVPPGDSRVKLFFREPALVKAASVVSGFTWVFLIIALFAASSFRFKGKRR